jgi:DNA invertase Pin-like site-specific DNA recombinase
MPKTKRAALYVRVSTDDQTTANQERDLRLAAERSGWEVIALYSDAGIGGGKGRDQRPGYDRLLKGIARKEFDLVAAWSVDRLGRSLQHLVSFLCELKSKGVGLYLHQQGIDTTTPAGEAMFGMMSVFAQFEKAVIRERTLAGLRRAVANGKKLGRPKLSPKTVAAIRAALADGNRSINRIATDLGVGCGTVHRIKVEQLRAEAH